MAATTDNDGRFDTALFHERYEMGGDGYLELAGTFVSYMDGEMQVLTAAIERGGLTGSDALAKDMASRAHGLAGSGSTFGLRGVQEAALQLERTIRQGQQAMIRACLVQLEEECALAREFLQRMTDES
ncbi:Hpt domain-containing protein [Oceanidesulfovibrio marinus]|nr:Hpt domain-containing protein [Oceanidesulfovibrio marinus]